MVTAADDVTKFGKYMVPETALEPDIIKDPVMLWVVDMLPVVITFVLEELVVFNTKSAFAVPSLNQYSVVWLLPVVIIVKPLYLLAAIIEPVASSVDAYGPILASIADALPTKNPFGVYTPDSAIVF